MKIGFLVIGSEVLNGKTSEANLKTLADFLKRHHLEILKSITVRDDETAIHQGLSVLFNDCDVIVTSGGLGPTRDDITKQTIATFLKRNLAYSAAAEKVASTNYQKFDRPFPGKEHGYCYLPDGFVALNNSNGFAPNLTTNEGDKILICGPGVPREFKAMLADHFLSLVKEKIDQNNFQETILVRTKKVPEEKIFGEVDPSLWDKLSIHGEVSSLPIIFGVDIGVKIKATTLHELNKKKNEVLQVFNASPIRSAIWHIGYEMLEEVIVNKANKNNIKFGLAESATGGFCSNLITNVPGASQTFIGSIVCYSEEIKMNLLGVKAETLKNHTVYSEEVAREMALGLAKSFKLDIALAITGLAGPAGGTPQTPVGTVFIATAVHGQVKVTRHQFKGDRDLLKVRFTQAALHALLEEMELFA